MLLFPLTKSNPYDAESSLIDLPEVDLLEQKYWPRIVGTSAVARRMPKRSSELQIVNEISGPSQPGMAERAVDTATDVSRTLTEVSAALQAAVSRLSDAITAARKPGMPLSTISAITREAPLASLFVAFLFGVAIGRRR
ncbi:hypothetical protein V1277_000910 [Bradyrhizobium sp. AZCC 1588]